MKLSLHDLLRRLRARSPARGPARGPRTTRLHLEQLAERVVPVINLMPYTFNLPGAGVLHVTWEVPNGNNATFGGTFLDVNSGITNKVSGQLKSLGGVWDQMNFQGAGNKLFEHEQVAFKGLLNEGPAHPPVMEGVVTESYWTYFPWGPPEHWATTHRVESVGVELL